MNDLFQPSEENRDYLSELVGEGKKFKDPQALARGKAESDSFIETLKNQLDELRTDYLRLDNEVKQRASIEELMRNQRSEPAATTLTALAPPPSRPTPEVNYDELIDSKLTQREQRRIEESNLSKTRELLRERFGQDYATKLRESINDIGLDEGYVNSLARKSPDAVYRLLGLEQTAEPFQTPPRTTSLMSRNRNEPVRNSAFYEKLRLENPAVYHSKQTIVQMHQDAQKMGPSFFADGLMAGRDKEYNRYVGPNAIIRSEEYI